MSSTKLKSGRRRRHVLLAAIVLAVIAGPGHAQAERETLRIGYQKYGTLILLKARGTLDAALERQGVDVRWTEFPAGPQLLEAMNVGSVDFGTTGETPPIFAQAAGTDLRYVAYEPPAAASEAILVPRDSGIHEVADLRGKRIALNKGSNVHYLLVRALEASGLSLDDVTPVYIKPGDARAAFERGDVDAWAIWDPYQADAEINGGARTLRDGRGLVANHQIYLASRALVDAHPDIVAAVVDAIADVDTWAAAHPEAVVDILHKETGVDEAALRRAVDRYGYGAKRPTPALINAQQAIGDAFFDLGLIPKPIDVSEVAQPIADAGASASAGQATR